MTKYRRAVRSSGSAAGRLPTGLPEPRRQTYHVVLKGIKRLKARYADKWDVVGADGQVIATRTLLHPHENEQPFTRSLSGVVIPDAVSIVTIRAHDSVHGYGGETVDVRLKR